MIKIDDGACKALIGNGTSLLAVGIASVEGQIEAGEAVSIQDRDGNELARGLVNYTSVEIDRIKGLKSDGIKEVLGRKDFNEVIHRDNLVVL